MAILKYAISLFVIFLAAGCADEPGKEIDKQKQESYQSTNQGQNSTNQNPNQNQNIPQDQTQNQGQDQNSSQDTSQSASPTYSKDIKPIIDNNCISCHGSGSQYPLDSYQKIMNGQTSCDRVSDKRYIVPSNSQESYLYKKLIRAQDICGSRMPPGSPLSQNEIDTVKKWIDAGAPE